MSWLGKNEIFELDDDIWAMRLKHGFIAQVDGEDLFDVGMYRWYADTDRGTGRWYARTRIAGTKIRMQSILMPFKTGYVINHIDGDGLNNTRRNLEYITSTGNLRWGRGGNTISSNATGERNIGLTKQGRYTVWLSEEGKKFHAGTYDTLEQAIIARDSERGRLLAKERLL
jgi:hypothetical protein